MRSLSALLDWLRGTIGVLYREAIKFGMVGAAAFVIDVGVMNLLRTTVLEEKPTTAKIISASLATAFAWVGNRSWTFRHRRNRRMHHEALLFFLANGVALLIGVAAIAASHYGLGLKSLTADNVANIIGIVLGTLFRFWAYRTFVFSKDDAVADAPGRQHQQS